MKRLGSTFLTLSLVVCSLVGCGALVGCDQKPSPKGSQEKPAPAQGALPAPDFSVKPKMEGALFTWVDKDGSFQLTDRPEAVPEHARKTVRVVADGHSPGGPDHVYVVDLSALSQNGPLPVRSLPRGQWEAMGKALRDKKVAELAPPKSENAPSPADLGVDAIVYGADWCKPCHLAEDYLKKKGARVVKKDIEEDPTAAAEMREKLKRAGLGGSSIPILDVGGTILKGFSEGAIDSALRRVKK
jgi:glutaredoxin